MPPKTGFKKAFIDLVIDVALARKKISNRMIARRLGITEMTIRRYRKDYPEFDRAFTEAREIVMEKINRTAVDNLSIRQRKIVKKSPDGVTSIVEDVLPTHNDVAVFGKIGLDKSIASELEDPRDVLRDVVKRKIAGELSALEAAQLLEAEGIQVPKTLFLEVEKLLGVQGDQDGIRVYHSLDPPGSEDDE
ncbi:helix-turn-helix domain-containing protein [Serratia fonticola]|uniref:helix-turn-helix domain-containing protein n=1 Tax=Serratia fonticola TaxID=47917 RepID=UPI00301BA625